MEKAFYSYKKLLERAGNIKQKREDHCKVIQRYYADNIIQIENSEPSIKGQQRLMEIENENLDGVNSIATNIKDEVYDKATETVWGLMIIKFDSRKTGKKKIEEAFMQKWANGKIVYQRFFYKKILNDK